MALDVDLSIIEYATQKMSEKPGYEDKHISAILMRKANMAVYAAKEKSLNNITKEDVDIDW